MELTLIRPDITPISLRAAYSPLVFIWRFFLTTRADRRATFQQGVGLGWTSVVLQRAKFRVHRELESY